MCLAGVTFILKMNWITSGSFTVREWSMSRSWVCLYWTACVFFPRSLITRKRVESERCVKRWRPPCCGYYHRQLNQVSLVNMMQLSQHLLSVTVITVTSGFSSGGSGFLDHVIDTKLSYRRHPEPLRCIDYSAIYIQAHINRRVVPDSFLVKWFSRLQVQVSL